MGEPKPEKRKNEASPVAEPPPKIAKGSESEGREEEEGDLSSGTFVFSCRHCGTIVGDSLSFRHIDREMQSISLCRASNIVRRDSLCTSSAERDCGTFFSLCCERCDKVIGRYYLYTPRSLDELRERFTFLLSEISTYVLGRGTMVAREVEQEEKEAEEAVDKEEEDKEEDDGRESLVEEIRKVQAVMLDMQERLHRLEAKQRK
eukprot:gene5707-6291_t